MNPENMREYQLDVYVRRLISNLDHQKQKFYTSFYNDIKGNKSLVLSMVKDLRGRL